MMENVRVDKKELLKSIKKNRDTHRATFEKAVEGYKIECLEMLEQHLDRIKNGKVYNLAINLPVPQDHTPEYDRVIKMLDMSLDDDINLPEYDFAQYVLDDWDWKRQWVTSNSSYLATSLGANK